MGFRRKAAAVQSSVALPSFLQGFTPEAPGAIWEAGHDPLFCHDPGCDRLACRGYRLGYQGGYRDGWSAGYSAGYAAGYTAGASAA